MAVEVRLPSQEASLQGVLDPGHDGGTAHNIIKNFRRLSHFVVNNVGHLTPV